MEFKGMNVVELLPILLLSLLPLLLQVLYSIQLVEMNYVIGTWTSGEAKRTLFLDSRDFEVSALDILDYHHSQVKGNRVSPQQQIPTKG